MYILYNFHFLFLNDNFVSDINLVEGNLTMNVLADSPPLYVKLIKTKNLKIFFHNFGVTLTYFLILHQFAEENID